MDAFTGAGDCGRRRPRRQQRADGSAAWRERAANARHCITGRPKRAGVLHPEFSDGGPEPDRFAAAARTAAR